jgi:apolipoprotein N-acyltransferase
MTTVTPSQVTPVKRMAYLRIALGIGLSVLTGVMLILAFHPFNIWPLAFFAFVPMLVAQHRLFPVKWAGAASAIGVGGWLFIFLMEMFGGNPAAQVIRIVVVVIVIIQILTVPGLRRFHERTGYRWLVLEGVFDWVGVEMIRSFIPPINTHAFIAQTMYTQPWMLQPISIFSIYGLGAVIMLVNFTLAQGALFLFDRRCAWTKPLPRSARRSCAGSPGWEQS